MLPEFHDYGDEPKLDGLEERRVAFWTFIALVLLITIVGLYWKTMLIGIWVIVSAWNWFAIGTFVIAAITLALILILMATRSEYD